MLTRNGISYNLKTSPYKESINYNGEKITYKFSSNMYQEKFINKIKDNRITINNSLSKRFGFKIENNVLCDLKLYLSIEKRGFLIETKEGLFECLSTIKLDGMNKIIKK